MPAFWQYGVVDNECPECLKGSLDLSRSYTVGDGRWDVEWFAVPCNVRTSQPRFPDHVHQIHSDVCLAAAACQMLVLIINRAFHGCYKSTSSPLCHPLLAPYATGHPEAAMCHV